MSLNVRRAHVFPMAPRVGAVASAQPSKGDAVSDPTDDRVTDATRAEEVVEAYQASVR